MNAAWEPGGDATEGGLYPFAGLVTNVAHPTGQGALAVLFALRDQLDLCRLLQDIFDIIVLSGLSPFHAA